MGGTIDLEGNVYSLMIYLFFTPQTLQTTGDPRRGIQPLCMCLFCSPALCSYLSQPFLYFTPISLGLRCSTQLVPTKTT